MPFAEYNLAKLNYMIPSAILETAMGNLWSSRKVRPVHGTYLEDRPAQRIPPQRVASFIPILPPAANVIHHRPPVPYKDKARRMFHELSLRRQAITQGIQPQTLGLSRGHRGPQVGETRPEG
jgi:hypothetical protein